MFLPTLFSFQPVVWEGVSWDRKTILQFLVSLSSAFHFLILLQRPCLHSLAVALSTSLWPDWKSFRFDMSFASAICLDSARRPGVHTAQLDRTGGSMGCSHDDTRRRRECSHGAILSVGSAERLRCFQTRTVRETGGHRAPACCSLQLAITNEMSVADPGFCNKKISPTKSSKVIFLIHDTFFFFFWLIRLRGDF